jgi:hypothetical protein
LVTVSGGPTAMVERKREKEGGIEGKREGESVRRNGERKRET